MWQRFLEDNERTIRDSAPKEPSAKERTALVRLNAMDKDTEREHAHHQRRITDEAEQDRQEAVGELWQPEEITTGPAWGDMDGRARRRRVGRALGTVAAVIVVVGAVSQLSTGSGTPSEKDGEATSMQSEDVPDPLHTATARPTAPVLDPDPASPVARAG
ncbi:hypothetical protein ACH40E_32325 [Streptomyces acidicola]|uniref:hypothetical protein n=1 Tax=Streptomyces acidicola TaxID=2596892 RepID=UPI003789D7DE